MPEQKRRFTWMVLFAAALVIFACCAVRAAKNEAAPVALLPIEGIIDSGMKTFVRHALAEAGRSGAAAVILELDTPGGYLQAAQDIRKLLDDFPGPVYAFVCPHALSAGAYLALAADAIYMAPGSALGAAEPRVLGREETDEKLLSAWETEMRAVAERRGRDSQVAAAMVRREIAIDGVVEKGNLLTLTTGEALALGYSEGTVEGRGALLENIGLPRAEIVSYSPRFLDQFAGWITHPVVATLLLIAGIAGLVIELFTAGFGLFGFISLLSFAFYFGGHYAAGLAEYWILILFGFGIVLLLIEAFIPGFGVFGITGILSIMASIVLAAPSIGTGLLMFFAALVLSAFLAFWAYRFFERRGTLRRIFLADEARTELGFVTAADCRDLCGLEGTALTPLRPAGTAQIGNRRIDVISEGEFIPAGAPVKVVLVEGVRVVVRRSGAVPDADI